MLPSEVLGTERFCPLNFNCLGFKGLLPGIKKLTSLCALTSVFENGEQSFILIILLALA